MTAGRPDAAPALHAQEFSIKTEDGQLVVETEQGISTVDLRDESGGAIAAALSGVTELDSIDGGVTSDTELTSLLGSNLSISGGALTAAGGGTTKSRVYVDAEQTVGNLGNPFVDIGATSFDEGTDWDIAGNAFEVPEDGIYKFTAFIDWKSNANWATGDQLVLQWQETTGVGTVLAAVRGRKVGTGEQTHSFPPVFQELTAGDSVALAVQHASSGDRVIDNGETVSVLMAEY